MPRIFDNIEKSLLPALTETLKLSHRADFCVGYFNLRGWQAIDDIVSGWQPWQGQACRVLVGMQRPPHDDIKALYGAESIGAERPLDNATATRLMTRFAEHLKEQGFDDPRKLAKYISENFQMTAGQYWGSDVVYSLVEPSARSGVEPFASWLKLPKDAMIKIYQNPDMIDVVVVGGETQALWFTTDMRCTQTVSVDKWRPKEGVYKEDERAALRRAARQKRHAAMLSRSGYDT